MKRIFLIYILMLSLPYISAGQTLDEYLVMAGENNPELKAYYNEYMAAMERIPQAGALPDPELGMGVFLRPMQFPMGNQRADVQLMQMFPWFGMLKTRQDEASKMALARFELFQNAKNELYYQVKNTWYQLYRLEEEIRVAQENLHILQQYERLALNRFRSAGTGSSSSNGSAMPESSGSGGASMGNMEGGTSETRSGMTNASGGMRGGNSIGRSRGGMADVLRVKMEIKDLEAQLEFLKDSRLPLLTEFNRHLNRQADKEVFVADSLSAVNLPAEWLSFSDTAIQNNPMLKMLDAEQEAFEEQKKMARLEGRPMFGVGVNYMVFSPRTVDGSSVGGHNMIMPMVRMSLPVYRKKYKAMHQEAEFGQKAIEYKKEDMQNRLSSEWQMAVRDYENATRKVRLYREQMELARQAMEILTSSYTTDGQDFEEVLQMQQQLLNYQFKLTSAIVEQYTSVAMLEMLTATALTD